MKLAVCIQTEEVPQTVPVALLEGSLTDKARKAKKLGFDGLELMTTDPSALDPQDVRAIMEDAGLDTVAVGSGAVAFAAGLTLLHADANVRDAARSRLWALIDFAVAIGAPLVTIGSFRGRLASVTTGTGGYQQLVAMLREGAMYADSRGVLLALEPLNRYETDVVFNAAEGLALLEEVDHPALGLLLDTYHVNIEESSWTEPFQRLMVAGKLWHVHLGDNNRLPPGQGLIDFPAIVATLKQSGYEGALSAELLARPGPDTAARLTAERMRPLLQPTSA